jgi:cytoskeleton protein RodZ
MTKGNFGERLKREREMREVSREEISSATRIATRYVEALENEDWGKLPGGVFPRGFVRTIARYLGLAEESLLAEFDLARKEQIPATPPPAESYKSSPPRWLPAVVVLLLLLGLIAGGVYGWRRYAARRARTAAPMSAQPESPTVAAVPVALPGKAVAATARQEMPLDLSVSTSAATRVRIVADDALLLDAELRAGENRHFSAKEQFEVTTADSSAVLLELNGQAMPPVGAPGSSGTILLSRKDLRLATGGPTQP